MSRVTLTLPLLAPRPIFCSLGSSLILWLLFKVYVVQSLSCVLQFVIPWTAACRSSLSFTVSWSSLRLKSIESVMPSNHLILCCPLLFLPSIFPSIRVFSNELALHIRWPNIGGASSLASVLPMSIQGLFPLGLAGLISLMSKGLPRVFSNTIVQKHQFTCIPVADSF